MSIENKQRALKVLLIRIGGIPEMRRDTTQVENLLWLSRNLGINNKSEDIPLARVMVRSILKDMRGGRRDPNTD